MTDTTGTVTNGPRNWGAGFMPATHQGVKLNPGMSPIRHLNLPKGVTPEMRRRQLEMLRQLNKQHLKSREGQSELEARIRAYELAYRYGPRAGDSGSLKSGGHKLYGFGNKDTEPFGRCCLMARQLVGKTGLCRSVAGSNGFALQMEPTTTPMPPSDCLRPVERSQST